MTKEPFGLVLAREHLATIYQTHIIVGIDETGKEPVFRVHVNTESEFLENSMIDKIIETLTQLKS